MPIFYHCISVEKLSLSVGFLLFAGKYSDKVNFLDNFAGKKSSKVISLQSSFPGNKLK
jgi:hypothetical protein